MTETPIWDQLVRDTADRGAAVSRWAGWWPLAAVLLLVLAVPLLLLVLA